MRLSYLFNVLAAVAVVGVLIFGAADSRAAFELMGASGARVAVELARGRGDPRAAPGCGRARSRAAR